MAAPEREPELPNSKAADQNKSSRLSSFIFAAWIESSQLRSHPLHDFVVQAPGPTP